MDLVSTIAGNGVGVGHYRLNSDSCKGLSLWRFHGRLPAFG
jgi:hypothetical protein